MRALIMVGVIVSTAGWQAAAQYYPADSVMNKRPAKNHFRSEILVVSENDNFALELRDGYYTNGLMFKYSHAQPAKGATGRLLKKVQGFELGQHIYNPVRFDSINIAGQDRPFAGYLYGRYDQRRFSKAGQMFQWSASLGVIGKSSFAAEVQNWYHGVAGIYAVKGWPTQLNDELSLNLGTQYARSLLNGDPGKRNFDITGIGFANLGNAHTNLGGGLMIRLGTMESYHRSLQWGSRVTADSAGAPRQRSELYVFLHPALTWQGYNAALQGGMFVSDKGPKTALLEPFYLTTQLGFGYAQNRWTLTISYINLTRKAKQQLLDETYISIQVAYRFAEGIRSTQ